MIIDIVAKIAPPIITTMILKKNKYIKDYVFQMRVNKPYFFIVSCFIILKVNNVENFVTKHTSINLTSS